jgi:hypothetical protein
MWDSDKLTKPDVDGDEDETLAEEDKSSEPEVKEDETLCRPPGLSPHTTLYTTVLEALY